jgi:hypothetical protein
MYQFIGYMLNTKWCMHAYNFLISATVKLRVRGGCARTTVVCLNYEVLLTAGPCVTLLSSTLPKLSKLS